MHSTGCLQHAQKLLLVPANDLLIKRTLPGCSACQADQCFQSQDGAFIPVRMHCACRSGGMQSVWHLWTAPDLATWIPSGARQGRGRVQLFCAAACTPAYTAGICLTNNYATRPPLAMA